MFCLQRRNPAVKVEECDYFQEAVRHQLEHNAELIENTHVDEVLLGYMQSKGIFGQEDLSKLKTSMTAKTLYELLLEKEEPEIWSHVFEVLEKTSKIHVYVVRGIKLTVEEIKKDHSKGKCCYHFKLLNNNYAITFTYRHIISLMLTSSEG